jgi:predicted nucleic acid-binding protein
MAPMRVVVDASALAGLVLPDEEAGRLAGILAEAEAVAPLLLWAEIRNVLLMAERRGRIGPGIYERATAILDSLDITFDTAPSGERTAALARRHGLTIYDAIYLELAQRLGLPLATTDRALVRAAQAENLGVI